MENWKIVAKQRQSDKISLAVIWCCMGFFALQASTEGLTYIFGDIGRFDPIFRDKYIANLTLVRTHGLCGATALVIGLLGFVKGLRKLRLHAYIGRAYLFCVLVASVTGVPMSLMAEGGASTRLSFTIMALLWFWTGVMAFLKARKKRFKDHRVWMIRNYSLTYSAVLSRLLLNGLQERGLTFQEIYPAVSWVWLIGVAVGHWWIWYSGKYLNP